MLVPYETLKINMQPKKTMCSGTSLKQISLKHEKEFALTLFHPGFFVPCSTRGGLLGPPGIC